MSPRRRKEVDVSTFEGRFSVLLRKLRDKSKTTVAEMSEKRKRLFVFSSDVHTFDIVFVRSV